MGSADEQNESIYETDYRVKVFARQGFSTMIVWEHEFDNVGAVVSKVSSFLDTFLKWEKGDVI